MALLLPPAVVRIARGVVTYKDGWGNIGETKNTIYSDILQKQFSWMLRIKNSSTNWPGSFTVSSFMNTDGSKVVVVLNRSGAKQKIQHSHC